MSKDFTLIFNAQFQFGYREYVGEINKYCFIRDNLRNPWYLIVIDKNDSFPDYVSKQKDGVFRGLELNERCTPDDAVKLINSIGEKFFIEHILREVPFDDGIIKTIRTL